MCGIAGYIGPPTRSAGSTVRAMLTAQSHRGPDGVGMAAWAGDAPLWEQFAKNVDDLQTSETACDVVLGHNLLAIQDVPDRARQPMRRGDLSIAFNGEIYNFIELRTELEATGERFETSSDTEVLLAAWRQEGPACLDRLRGMFAFLIHDRSDGALWAARDPFGIKPLYRAEVEGGFLLASEMRALHAAGVPRSIRRDAALASAAAGVNSFGATETLYEGIHEVPPGALLRFDHEGMRVARMMPFAPPRGDDATDAAIERLASAFDESVRLHLRSTRRIATCLSGGLDSTNLVWSIGQHRDLAGTDFTTFTASSVDHRDSEVDLAAMVTRKAALPHRVVECDATIEPRDVLHMAIACETPNHTVGPINQFLLLRAIARDGATVVLDGQGGDELLSGYAWYWPVLMGALRQRGVDTTPFETSRQMRLPFTPELTAHFDRVFHDAGAWVRAVMAGETLLGVSHEDVAALRETQYYLHGGGDWAAFRERSYLRGELHYLLRQEDRIGMWFGLECRVPFVDRTLIECAADLSPELLVRDGYLKYPFRVMQPEIPEAVRWTTRKRGFWDTDQQRYRWLKPLANELALASPLLRGLFPALEAQFHRLNFNQSWRLLQLAMYERCATAADADALLDEYRATIETAVAT
jgi:asparagine synthase (glutamine-hydrolysing)